MKFPILSGIAVLLGAASLQAAPPVVIVVPTTSAQNYVLVDPYRPKPKVYDPYFYEVKTKNKKTIVKQNSAGMVTVKEKKKNKETITVRNRNGNVVYKETIKKKKK
jgi:hypothetical protein